MEKCPHKVVLDRFKEVIKKVKEIYREMPKDSEPANDDFVSDENGELFYIGDAWPEERPLND